MMVLEPGMITIIIAYSAGFHGKIGERWEECDNNEGKLSAICQENLTGVRVVRAFGRERAEIDKFQKQNAYYTSPAFNGSSTARDQVGALLTKCLTMFGDDVDAQIDKAFEEAVKKCIYS